MRTPSGGIRKALDLLGAEHPTADRSRTFLARALLGVAVLLFTWILVLGSTTRGQAEVRNWSTAWVGMDVLQVAGLLATGRLLVLRSRRTALAAAASSTLLLLDAWFDVLTAEGGGAWYTALAMALLVELPAALALAALAHTALDWQGGAAGPRSTPLPQDAIEPPAPGDVRTAVGQP
ncbi:hypothetical protein [Kitasatospora sp. NPDC101183]|uniref:hypothetical protein n=1 Tax=Kitasatospora sp. NPDC101183 TaxID=3364100 RepID=UPI0037F61DEF